MKDHEDATANPAPLGLMGFGMTTLLLNLHNAGFIALGSVILAMGIFYGGIAQVIAGIMEWRKGNTFGMTAFISFGFFWISTVALILMPSMGLGSVTEPTSMAWFFGIWGVFSVFLLIGLLRSNRMMQLVFSTLTLLFFLLAISEATGSGDIKTLAGYVGLLTGSAAIYVAMAEVLRESLGRDFLPLWPVKQ
ncbi:MAG: acetate uptake transporter [Methanomassiliicoccales archaeon]|jgi:succinate-acetate transporter protein